MTGKVPEIDKIRTYTSSSIRMHGYLHSIYIRNVSLWRTLLLKVAFLIMSENVAPAADHTNLVLLRINKSVDFEPLSGKDL